MVGQTETPPARKPIITSEDLTALGGAGLYLAFFLVMTLFNAHPPRLPSVLWAIIAPLTTVLYLLVLVNAIRLLCRQTRTARQETVLMFSFLLFFIILNPTVNQVVNRLLDGESLKGIIASLASPDKHPILDILVPFLLILTGVYLGQLLARLIRERSILVPVLLVSALVDLWGVYWGPVSIMTESAPAAVSGMATATTAAAQVPAEVMQHMPPQMAIFGNISPPENIGIGDFVFLAFFLTCAYRLGFSVLRSMWGIFAGLLLASVVFALNGVSIFGFEISITYLPGLLFICGGVLLANWGAWKLSRQEWIMTAVCVALLGSVVAVFAADAYHREAAERREARGNQVRMTKRAYTLPITGDSAFIHAVIAGIPRGKDTDVIPLQGHFLYSRTSHPPQLERWGLLVLARKTGASPREYLLRGMRSEEAPSSWQVREQTITPPQYAPQYIESAPNTTTTEALRTAKGIPESAFSMLRQAGSYANAAGTATVFQIWLSTDSAQLTDERGKVIKMLPYATETRAPR